MCILCLPETFLDSGILSDEFNLDVPGYNLVRADHPANAKHDSFLFIFENLFV